ARTRGVANAVAPAANSVLRWIMIVSLPADDERVHRNRLRASNAAPPAEISSRGSSTPSARRLRSKGRLRWRRADMTTCPSGGSASRCPGGPRGRFVPSVHARPLCGESVDLRRMRRVDPDRERPFLGPQVLPLADLPLENADVRLRGIAPCRQPLAHAA